MCNNNPTHKRARVSQFYILHTPPPALLLKHISRNEKNALIRTGKGGTEFGLTTVYFLGRLSPMAPFKHSARPPQEKRKEIQDGSHASQAWTYCSFWLMFSHWMLSLHLNKDPSLAQYSWSSCCSAGRMQS